MNMMKSFNSTIDYLETTLDDEVDDRKVANLSGYSVPMFSRLFSILTGMTLSEYLRGRKLTQSAMMLRETDEKIIDIAFRFGYESPDSFGAAFKNHHGCTPSDVRKGAPFKITSKVQLVLSIRGGRSMNISIERKGAFSIAGINEQNISSTSCPDVWSKLYSQYSHEEMSALGKGEKVGVCHDVDNPSRINYMAGYIITDVDKARLMSLDVLEVKEAEYAVIELMGKIPDCIHNGWKYAMEVFFPEHGYAHSGKPDFEYYHEGNPNSSDYMMELWIPIEKA